MLQYKICLLKSQSHIETIKMMFGQEMNTFNNLTRHIRNDDIISYGRKISDATFELNDIVYREGKVCLNLILSFTFDLLFYYLETFHHVSQHTCWLI